MNFSEAIQSHLRRTYPLLLIIIALVSFAACSNREPAASPTAAISPTPSATAGDSASEWLTKAQAAARTMKSYGFELQMHQKLTGTKEVDKSNVEISMQGRAELNPLKLDQTIKSDIDGEASTLRAVLVPDAYYMYLPEYEEWSKLSKEISKENVKTLSAFQVNPEQALKDIQQLGNSLTAEQNGQVVTIRYEGTGPEASVYLAGILESTMGLSGMDKDIQESLDIQKLNVTLTLDAERAWPLSYRIESDMSIEFELGNKSTVNQTLAGTYSKHNASAAVTVPKEALNAIDPDKLDEQLDLDNLGGDK